MKITDETRKILTNFAAINQSLAFQAGTRQVTKAASAGIFAEAFLAEEFPRSFAIYDLKRLLALLSFFEDPDLVFEADALVIKGNTGQEIRFRYCNPEVLTKVPTTPINMPPIVMNFTLSEDLRLSQLASQLQAVDLVVSLDGKVRLTNVENESSANQFVGDLKDVDRNPNVTAMSAVFKMENLTLLPGSYRVSIAAKGERLMGRFANESLKVTYYIPADHHSTITTKDGE